MAIRIDDNLLAAAISYVRSLTQRRTFFMKIERSPRLAPNPLLRAKRTSQMAGGMSAIWYLPPLFAAHLGFGPKADTCLFASACMSCCVSVYGAKCHINSGHSRSETVITTNL